MATLYSQLSARSTAVGQLGGVILEQGLPFRPDWEHVVTPVVDYALTRAEVDGANLALMGLSFGGYLAPRAATGEHRLAACISDGGNYDLFDVSAQRLPGVLARQVPRGNPVVLALLDRFLRRVMAKPTAGWALRRNLLVHGLTEPLQYFRIAPQYTLKGCAHLIRCPTLICVAEGDDLSADIPALYAALTCEKRYVAFTAAEGAAAHCESGARTLFHQRAFDWLATVMAAPPPAKARA